MLRSMYSGISGMKNFQTKLDVIGNNIANVNTYGFKKGRVTFKDTMNQMLSGATASSDNRGGKNAVQVGLGSSLATIDNIHTTGNMQTTGRSLDLGIDGDGYFIVNQGNQSYYTRAGNFYLDDNGTLVNADGLKVQAFQFDANGNLTNQLGDVAINVNGLLPGIASTGIKFSENLSANAIKNTVFSQQIVVVDDRGLKQNSTIYYKKLGQDQWGIYANEAPKPSSVVTTGGIKVTNPEGFTGNNYENWKLTYENDGGNKYFLTLGDGTKVEMAYNEITKKLQVANAGDQEKLNGLQLDLSGYVKPSKATIDSDSIGSSLAINVIDDDGYTGNNDLQWKVAYLDDPAIVTTPGYYLQDTTNPSNNPIHITGNGPMDIPINGGAELITIDVSGWRSMPKPGNNATADEVEEYSKYISYIGTIDLKAKTPLDPAQGTPIEVGEINITPETQPLHILNFVDGKIPYDESLRNFSFEIPTGLINDEETVADESKQMVNLQFDFSSLSQYEGATTALINPNGSIEGALESFSIGSGGEITGVYSNGELVILGQLAIAKFSNSSGLMNAGGNLFQESINSGNPDIDVPGVGRGSLSAGSLEMSNVDLSEEFTEMITAQRGFQANTRIITTSDEILQELVNLKR